MVRSRGVDRNLGEGTRTRKPVRSQFFNSLHGSVVGCTGSKLVLLCIELCASDPLLLENFWTADVQLIVDGGGTRHKPIRRQIGLGRGLGVGSMSHRVELTVSGAIWIDQSSLWLSSCRNCMLNRERKRNILNAYMCLRLLGMEGAGHLVQGQLLTEKYMMWAQRGSGSVQIGKLITHKLFTKHLMCIQQNSPIVSILQT
jgi:hypothetical protein